MAYLDRSIIVEDSTFKQYVRLAVADKFEEIVGEDPLTVTGGQVVVDKRHALAMRMTKSDRALINQFVILVATKLDKDGVDISSAAGPTPAEYLNAVESCWNDLAGVTYSDLNST